MHAHPVKKMIQMKRASQVKKINSYMPQNLLKRKYPGLQFYKR